METSGGFEAKQLNRLFLPTGTDTLVFILDTDVKLYNYKMCIVTIETGGRFKNRRLS